MSESVAPSSRPSTSDTSTTLFLPGIDFALAFLLLGGLFIFCGELYGRRFPLVATEFDVWFGTDINHYMHWVKQPSFIYRFPLHPATLLILKPYGLLIGQFLPLDARFLALFALPVVAFNTTVLIFSLRLLAIGSQLNMWVRLLPSFFSLLPVLFIGPLLLLAPIPESHTMGGMSLLIQSVLVWKCLQKPIEERRKETRGVVFWAIAATGFSLSNIVPAILVAFPLWQQYRPTKKQIIGVMGSVVAIGLLGIGQIGVKFFQEHHTGSFLSFVGERFARWIHMPDSTAVLRSFRGLVMAQFGVPTTDRCPYTAENGMPYSGVMLKDAPNTLQIVAALCWFGGIFWWFWQARRNSRHTLERTFVLGCFFALSWLITFHSFFASDEAFMFSVHAWPFILLPGMIIAQNCLTERRIPSLIPLVVAFMLSLIQTCIALPALFRLPF